MARSLYNVQRSSTGELFVYAGSCGWVPLHTWPVGERLERVELVCAMLDAAANERGEAVLECGDRWPYLNTCRYRAIIDE